MENQDRRPSIAERATAVIEAKLGDARLSVAGGMGEALRKASGVFNSTSSLGLTPEAGLDGGFSMNAEDYELRQVIGQGSSAMVYLATYKPNGKPVSIKVIDLDMFERNQIDELRRELQIMTLSRHQNLLPVYGSFVSGSKLYIVTPVLSAGSGLDIMKTAFQRGMEEAVIATILKQVLQGLEYLHAHGLIHRDIKAGNLLVNSDGLVQLADFGVSSSLTDHGARGTSRKTFVGTPCWMAPEVMDQSGYNYKADIWSFGITALELANGHAPYAKFPPMKVLMLTLQNPPPTLDRDKTFHKYSKAFKDMIDACLQKEPTKRPTAEKLLAHPFFKIAKKPQYLTGTLLHGLPPLTERAHLRNQSLNKPGSQDDTNQNEEWDFDEPSAASASQPPESRPRVVTFDAPMVIQESPSMTEEPAESASLQRNSATAMLAQESTSTVASVTRNASEISTSSSLPRKSRFVVDNPNATFHSNRTDSTTSAQTDISLPGTATSTGPPQQSPQLLPAQVKKGRFSVIDSAAPVPGQAKEVPKDGFALPPPVGTPSVSSQAASPLQTPLLRSELGKGDEAAGPGAAGAVEGSQRRLTVVLERKAGRFAYQNLPPSAVTSPTLTPTDGPKVPRKFTVVSESSAPTQSPPPQAGATASLVGKPIRAHHQGDKKSRFKIVDNWEDFPAYLNAVQALAAPLPALSAPVADTDLSSLLKQNELQRQVIHDLVALLKTHPPGGSAAMGSGVTASPQRASSADSTTTAMSAQTHTTPRPSGPSES
ncbi:hypothetical protein HDV03_003992 [Kappamyces sp. JEL0829]|nr:hypothetical protein HDV03_003992 [Kappamyces sp. JEL0829]